MFKRRVNDRHVVAWKPNLKPKFNPQQFLHYETAAQNAAQILRFREGVTTNTLTPGELTAHESLLSTARRTLGFFRDSIADLVDSGILSESPDGNYSVGNRTLGPDFLNPKQDGRRLYFTTEAHAREYGAKVLKDKPIEATCNGNFIAPDQMTETDWRVLVVRTERESEDRKTNLLRQIEVKGHITTDATGFVVYRKVGERSTEINLGFYFPTRDAARGFTEAFKGIEELEIREYSQR